MKHVTWEDLDKLLREVGEQARSAGPARSEEALSTPGEGPGTDDGQSNEGVIEAVRGPGG